MVDLTYPQLNSSQGTDTAETLRNYANAAANLVCDMYAAYPSGIIPNLGDPSGVGAFTQGLMDSLCHPRGKQPPPPQSPFNGGQCVNVSYRVTYTASYDGNPNDGGTVTLPGKIGGASVSRDGGTDSYKRYKGEIAYNGGVYGAFSGAGGNSNGQSPATISIVSIVRADGAPDTCGNPPPVYPPILPPAPNYTTNAPVTINNAPVTIPVTIIPTVFAPVTNFRPEINVNVGGVKVNFDLGGVNFTVNPPAGTTPVLPPNDTRPAPPTSTPPKSPSAPSQTTDLSEVYRQLALIKACACPKDMVARNTTYGNARGLATALPDRSKYVTLQVSPSLAVRYQVSEGNAPDVFYVGWLSFGVDGVYGERKPVSFAGSAFLVPDGATHVAYSLTFGSTGVLRVYYVVDVVPI